MSILPDDKLCHDSWDSQFNIKSSQCLSPNTRPYRAIDGDDKNIYYWCEKHAAKWVGGSFKQMTPDEVTIIEIMES